MDKVSEVLIENGVMTHWLDDTKKELCTILIERLEKEKDKHKFGTAVDACISAVKEVFDGNKS
jgi:hypothetical protein